MINDSDPTLRPGNSTDVWPGSANPTGRNIGGDVQGDNFVRDPTTDSKGAGAGDNFDGDRMAKKALYAEQGVVESYPGIIESTNVHPLREDSNKDDGWANATVEPGSGNQTTATDSTGTTVNSMVNNATTMATGAAKVAYGTVTGDKEMTGQGKAAVYGTE